MEEDNSKQDLESRLDWHSTRLNIVFGEGGGVYRVAFDESGRIYAEVNGIVFIATASFNAGSDLGGVLEVERRKGKLTDECIVTEGEIVINGSSSSTALQRIGTPESVLYLNPEKHQIWQPI